jgi:hypothetical protein
MRSVKAIVIVILLFVAAPGSVAFAGLSWWLSDVAVSQDERFILVSISEDPLEVEVTHAYDDHRKELIRDIRSRYSVSGLYRNDGSAKPLWTDDGRWYGQPIIAPDGAHVIYEGNWKNDPYGARAVAFTKRGITLRLYDSSQVIPQFVLKAVLNGLSPPDCSSTTFRAKEMTYTVRTNQGEEIDFDVTTGDVIAVRSPFPTYFAIVGILLARLVGIYIEQWRRKRCRMVD